MLFLPPLIGASIRYDICYINDVDICIIVYLVIVPGPDFLQQELNSRFLASQDRQMAGVVGPPPYMRNDGYAPHPSHLQPTPHHPSPYGPLVQSPHAASAAAHLVSSEMFHYSFHH